MHHFNKNPNIPQSMRPYYQQILRGLGWGVAKSFRPMWTDTHLDSRCHGMSFDVYKKRLSSLEACIKDKTAFWLDVAYASGAVTGLVYYLAR